MTTNKTTKKTTKKQKNTAENLTYISSVSTGLAILSMLIAFCISADGGNSGVMSLLSILTGVLGLVTASVAMKHTPYRALNMISFVMSIVHLSFIVLSFIFLFFIVSLYLGK